MIYLQRNSEAWHVAWSMLRIHLTADGLISVFDDIDQANEGERWQHMGATQTGVDMLHHFRHRLHPKSSLRLDYKIRTAVLDTDGDAEAAD